MLDQKIIDACGRIRDRDDAIHLALAVQAAERERCAGIADAWAGRSNAYATKYPDEARKESVREHAYRSLADAIRKSV